MLLTELSPRRSLSHRWGFRTRKLLFWCLVLLASLSVVLDRFLYDGSDGISADIERRNERSTWYEKRGEEGSTRRESQDDDERIRHHYYEAQLAGVRYPPSSGGGTGTYSSGCCPESANNDNVLVVGDSNLSHNQRNRAATPCGSIRRHVELGSKKAVLFHYRSCQDTYIGDAMTRLYYVRLMAASAGASFSYRCGDINSETTSVGQLLQQHFKKDQHEHQGDMYPRTTVKSLLQIPFFSTAEFSTQLIATFLDISTRDSDPTHRPIGTPLSNNTVAVAQEPGHAASIPSLHELCNKFGQCRNWFPHECPSPGLELASEMIRQDFRFLASKVASSNLYQTNNLTVDVAVHVWCGDIVPALENAGSLRGLLPHDTYIKLIREASHESLKPLRNISITTLPFDPQFLNDGDKPHAHMRQLVVMDLVSHLRQAFPNVTVLLHNEPSETTPIIYARLVNARVATICGPSTFCLLPTIASWGRGYLYKGGLYPWAEEVEARYNDVTVYESPLLLPSGMSGEEIIIWLRRKTLS